MNFTNILPKAAILLVFTFCLNFASAQENMVWTRIEAASIDKMNEIPYRSDFKNYHIYQLNRAALQNVLTSMPQAEQAEVVLSFPIDDRVEDFKIYKTEIMSPVLAAKYPSIQTYAGKSLRHPSLQINLTVTPFGVYGMIIKEGNTWIINPLTYSGNKYMVFNKNEAYTDLVSSAACLVDEELEEEVLWNTGISKIVNNTTLKRYRLALACTSQYANYHVQQAGLPASATDEEKKTAVLAAMVVTMNRVNGVYEREIAVQLQLIDNNDLLIQLNAATDPYSNFDTFAMLEENQTQVNSVIGLANYDIGHVFSTGGGGVAFLGSVCTFFKAGGVTGLPAPVGDPFDIDYVAHEMGHQFGATHTFNNSCGGNRTNETAMEPGSGSTIMAYANICPPNVQGASDDYFHAISVTQMYNFINFEPGADCAENIVITNTPPVIDVPLQDYTIPVNTPFFLEVEASDADGDALTYTWEQLNNEISTQPPVQFNTQGPNFRSVAPSTSPRRYFPNLPTVLAGDLSNTWEVLPFLERTMEFGVLVRDNRLGGGQSTFGTTFISFAPGPFSVTSQNTPGIVWEPGETETITWNVANTNVAPINSPEVTILLSTNVNQDFNVVLAESVPNTGSFDIEVPDIFAPSCRIMVKGANSIFYSLNAESFSINSQNGLECFEEEDTNTAAIPDGNGPNQAGDALVSTLNFTQNSILESILVQVDITHPFIQDLVIELVSPSNEVLTLFDRDCGSEDGINVIFSDAGNPIPEEDCENPLVGTFQASGGSLNQWLGSSINGDWSLVVRDFWNEDAGQLNAWSIEVCTSNLSTFIPEAGQFFISPNPNSGRFQINFSILSGNELKGNLYNVQGKLIQSIPLQAGVLAQEIQLGEVQEGMYLLQVVDGSNTYVEKLLIR